MEKIGIRPTRSLGQNFLRDESIAEREVNAAGITKKDTVLEIGPGLGVLTDEIVELAGKTILVEKDERLASYLKGRYEEYDVDIIEGDILDIEIPQFDKVVSNLPFSISSPITFKLLEQEFDVGVLMYQKQFADRMRARVNEDDYCRLSVMVSTLADVERLFDIPRDSFYPPPNVDATVVRLIPGEPSFDLQYEKTFASVVKELFNYRRKKIRNGLETGFGVDVDDVPYGERRVETLTPEQIAELTEYLVENGIIDCLD